MSSSSRSAIGGSSQPVVGAGDRSFDPAEHRRQLVEEREIEGAVLDPDVVDVDRSGRLGRGRGEADAFRRGDLHGADVLAHDRHQPGRERPEAADLASGRLEARFRPFEGFDRRVLLAVGGQLEPLGRRVDRVGHVAERPQRDEPEHERGEDGGGREGTRRAGDRPSPPFREPP